MANILFAKELQRRFDEEGIPAIAVSLHPGDIATGKLSHQITFHPQLTKLSYLLKTMLLGLSAMSGSALDGSSP